MQMGSTCLNFRAMTEGEVRSHLMHLLVPGLGVQSLSRTKQIAVVLATAKGQPDQV